MRIKRVKRERSGYVLSFNRDDQIVLGRITRRTLNWSSLTTGDAYTLSKCS